MSESKLEAIYPLSYLQNGLLLHHLYNEKNDSGLIQIEAEVIGNLDIEIFQNSWNKTIQRHEMLRASIHHENIKTPVIAIHPKKEIEIKVIDYNNLSTQEQNLSYDSYKLDDHKKGLELSQAPSQRVTIFKLRNNKIRLFWTIHHILIDGWSITNILDDVLLYYNNYYKQDIEKLKPLIKYKQYLKVYNQQDFKKAEDFWTSYFEGFELESTISQNKNSNNSEDYRILKDSISEELTEKLRIIAKELKITENVIFQAVWTLIYSSLFQTKDFCVGITTSGRQFNIPNIEKMVGMFNNLIPIRVKVEDDIPIVTFLKTYQKKFLNIHDFENVPLHQIQEWSGIPSSKSLFETLFLFGRFNTDNLSTEKLSLKNLKNNTPTSNFPLTLIVQPSDNSTFFIKHNTSIISNDLAEKIKIAYLKAVIHISKIKNYEESISLRELTYKLNLKKVNLNLDSNLNVEDDNNANDINLQFISPTETSVLNIWEDTIGQKNISVNDDFFELGGTSLQAVKLSSIIKEKLDFNLQPTLLLKNRTIKSIANLIDSNKSKDFETWRSLVTLNEKGNKTPLFCLHSTGGFTLIYKAFANHFINKRPVYSLQPKGLDGVSPLHKSLEELAEDYIKEMQTVQPNGPYFLLAYCWIPSAIVNEIAVKLNAMGEIANIIAVDSNFYNSKGQRNIGKLIAVLKLDMVRIKILIREVSFKLKQWMPFLYNKNNLVHNKAKLKPEIIKKVDDNIAKFFRSYKAKPINGSVLCVISASFIKHHKYEINPRIWKKIAQRGFKKVILGSDHGSVFTEPSVKPLSKIVDDYMEINQNNN